MECIILHSVYITYTLHSCQFILEVNLQLSVCVCVVCSYVGMYVYWTVYKCQ